MDIERKLATIERVKKVEPLVNSDRLDVVKIRNWYVVTSRNEFKEGDLAVYFEIDSFLKDIPKYSFLGDRCYKEMGNEKGYLIKTIRLRGQLSQGLLMPLKSFPEIRDIYEGNDVTDLLEVKLFEKYLSDSVEGSVPKSNLSPRTDQQRIQNLKLTKLIEYNELSFEETIKLDGSSMSVYFYNGEIGLNSRNRSLSLEHDTRFSRAFNSYNFNEKLRTLGKNIAIQGELMGVGIQKNREKLRTLKFYVFDIYDIDSKRYLLPEKRRELVKLLDLDHVPVLDTELNLNISNSDSISILLERANGESLNNDIREGIVLKANQYIKGSELVSFKIISNTFLLKCQ